LQGEQGCDLSRKPVGEPDGQISRNSFSIFRDAESERSVQPLTKTVDTEGEPPQMLFILAIHMKRLGAVIRLPEPHRS